MLIKDIWMEINEFEMIKLKNDLLEVEM